MRKNIIFALIFSLFAFFFTTTCYHEVPHIVTLHYALPGDIYNLVGEKHFSGEIQFTVYPSQTLFDVTSGKDPSSWNWDRVSSDKKWAKTEYGDYGFTTKNGTEIAEPYIFSCPWTKEIEFIVDNIQNTQTIGLFDEIYDVKDLYVNYIGPTDVIEVEFVFYQNQYSGTQVPENLIGVDEKKITRKYLAGTPITDTPFTITDNTGSWQASKPVTEYSCDRFQSTELSDFGYLTYDTDAPAGEAQKSSKTGLYYSFVDNACTDGKAFTTPSGKYTFRVTDDDVNPDKYQGLTYISNDLGYILPRGVPKIQVTPQYEEPTAEVTYFYYNERKTDAKPEYVKWKEEYRIGEKLRSPEELAEKYKYDSRYVWNKINKSSSETKSIDYGYVDQTTREQTIHPTYNFRAVKSSSPFYIFDETNDKGVTISGKEHSIYSNTRVLRNFNIKPFYNKSGSITLIFNYNANKNADTFQRLSASCVVPADDEFVFDFEFGKSDDADESKNVLKNWLINEPYKSYGIGYGYREYDASLDTTKGTLYYFNPIQENTNKYEFSYYQVNDTTGVLDDDSTVITFGSRLNLKKFSENEIDYVTFAPVYKTQKIKMTFKHQSTVKQGYDYDESEELVSEIEVVQGEKFIYSDEEIKDWNWLSGTDLDTWSVDEDVENYGYVENIKKEGETKAVESWWDFDKTKDENETEASYKFVIDEGENKGDSWTTKGYVLAPLVLKPKYAISTTDITLVYYVTLGNSSGNKTIYEKKRLERTAKIPRGQFDINPYKFNDSSYPWYDETIGSWPFDCDDYAHSLARREDGSSSAEKYNLDFRNELQFGYRDPEDYNHRWYFGDDLNYAEVITDTDGNKKPYKAFRYVCIEGEHNGEEFVSYTDTRSTAPENTNTSRIKQLTITPKYVDAGYAAVPYMFKSKSLTTQERSALSRRNSSGLNDSGQIVENLSKNHQDEQDTLLSKYAINLVYIPGSKSTSGTHGHSESSWPSSTKYNSTNIDNVSEDMKNSWATRHYVFEDNNNTNLRSLTDLEEFYNVSSVPTGTAINDILCSESWLSRHFVLELFRCYYNHLLGLTGTSDELKDADFNVTSSTAPKNILKKLRTINYDLANYIKFNDYTTLSGKYKNIIYSREELPGHVFVVSPRMLVCRDLDSTGDVNAQALQYYWLKDLGLCAAGIEDAITICNIMTYMYNVENNANLSFVYLDKLTNVPYSGHAPSNMTDPPSSADFNYQNANELWPSDYDTIDTADGFRLMTHQELEYVSKIITNEMMLGVENETSGSEAVPGNCYNLWTYKKDTANNIDHYFKTGLSASCQGLKYVPQNQLSEGGIVRSRTNRSEYVSYEIDDSVEGGSGYRFLSGFGKMKTNLNLRNGANLFDIDGYFNIFVNTGFAESSVAGGSRYLIRQNAAAFMKKGFGIESCYTADFMKIGSTYTEWSNSFRVCRQINH